MPPSSPIGPDEQRGALAALLRAVGESDRDSFEELYRRTSAKLLGVCLRILPERTQAEEALQEAYLTIWRRAESFDEARGTAMTWLISVARNRAIDRRRAGGKLATDPIDTAPDIADDAPDAFDRLDASRESQRLAGCMARLADADARFLRHAFIEGATYPELATAADLPLGTVKSRIRRALLKLRECLS